MDNKIRIEIQSFSYRSNSIPKANMLFDVRFIDNPYWDEELRPYTGLDARVQTFVMNQKVTQIFLDALKQMLLVLLPVYAESVAQKAGTASELGDIYTIAFGCTGGQHRSVAIVEATAILISQIFPNCTINICHREIGEKRRFVMTEQINNREAQL